MTKIADAGRAIRHVFIRNLELPAQIGVYRHEVGKMQPVRINLDLAVEDVVADDQEAVVGQLDDGRVGLVDGLPAGIDDYAQWVLVPGPERIFDHRGHGRATRVEPLGHVAVREQHVERRLMLEYAPLQRVSG